MSRAQFLCPKFGHKRYDDAFSGDDRRHSSANRYSHANRHHLNATTPGTNDGVS